MTVVIRFTERQEELALPILLRHSPGTVLPDRTYVVSDQAVRALREAGVRFAELTRSGTAPSLAGAEGERI